MKKLHLFMLKSFVGPFVATFFISMFVLIMQFCGDILMIWWERDWKAMLFQNYFFTCH